MSETTRPPAPGAGTGPRDLVERLRRGASTGSLAELVGEDAFVQVCSVLGEAADEIERLRALVHPLPDGPPPGMTAEALLNIARTLRKLPWTGGQIGLLHRWADALDAPRASASAAKGAHSSGCIGRPGCRAFCPCWCHSGGRDVGSERLAALGASQAPAEPAPSGQNPRIDGATRAMAHALCDGPDGEDWLRALRLAPRALEEIEERGYVMISRPLLDELERQAGLCDCDEHAPAPLLVEEPDPDAETMCPHCGRVMACEGLTPWHPYGLGMCPGSQQNPRNALTDCRPLWNGEPNRRSYRWPSAVEEPETPDEEEGR